MRVYVRFFSVFKTKKCSEFYQQAGLKSVRDRTITDLLTTQLWVSTVRFQNSFKGTGL